MGKTSIEWTDRTVNPIRARLNGHVGHHCVKVSPGCTNCYASQMQRGFGLPPYEVGKRKDVEPFFDAERLREVLRRKVPTKWFWCDMSDLFGEWVPDEWIDQCFAVMAATSRHTHQVLTKRPERMRAYVNGLADRGGSGRGFQRLDEAARRLGVALSFEGIPWPIPSVWLGVSVEDQQRADERTPFLLETPAVVRFLSCEPLLGPITFPLPCKGSTFWRHGLDWLIVGGESGSGARPCDVQWVYSIVEQCRAANVPVFVKQLGRRPVTVGSAGWSWPSGSRIHVGRTMQEPGWAQLRDRKGGDPAEWPEDLRVREYPS